MKSINKKSILIAIVIIMVGLLITGGTYAYLTVAVAVTNGNYATSTHCFNVTYTFEKPQIVISSITDIGSGANVDLNSSYVLTANGDDDIDTGKELNGFDIVTLEQLSAGKAYVLEFEASFAAGKSFYFGLYPGIEDENWFSSGQLKNGVNKISFESPQNIEVLDMRISVCFSGDCNITFSNIKIYDGNPPLFPSSDAFAGLSEGVTAVADASCGLNGKGTLNMHIDSGTNNLLTRTVAAHCENENTLETQKDYTTQSACTAVAGNKWVTNGTALKYAVFSGNDLYNRGYIKDSDIGNDIVVHDGFSVTTTSKKFVVYVWLDGYLSDDSYYDLAFNSSIKMITSQTKSTATYPGDTPLVSGYLTTIANNSFDTLYQRVEYIKSTGTQYIDTGYYPNSKTGVDTSFKFNDLTVQSRLFGVQGSDSDSTSFTYVFYINGSSKWAYGFKNGAGNWVTTNVAVNTNKHSFKFNVNSGYYSIDNGTDKAITSTTRTQTANYSMLLFGTRAVGSAGTSGLSKSQIYSFKIYDNNSLVRDFIPVTRKVDSKPGLYDMVNGVFYTNAATSGDDFAAGPDV